MNLDELLRKIRELPEIQIEERKLGDGTTVYVFFSVLPFPRAKEAVWYAIPILPGETTVDRKQVESMLRHLWMLQADVFDDD